MKAAVVHEFGQGPRYDELAAPVAGEREELVQVLAAALSPRARSGASGRHYTSSGADVLPLVPGIDGVGRRADGQRAYFLGASEKLGTMASETVAVGGLMVPLPDCVGASLVAAAMLPAISSWVALSLRAALKPGQKVLVLGATGTSGQLAVQIAKELGASEVVAAGRSRQALEATRALGADHIVELTGSNGDGAKVAAVASEVDVVLDYLWGTVTSALLPAICRQRQDESRPLTWVLIGSVAGDEIALSSVLLRKRNLHIVGSGQGSVSTEDMFSVTPAIMSALAAGRLQASLKEVPLAEVEKWWAAKLPSGERLVFVP